APTHFYALAARDRVCRAGGSCVTKDRGGERFPRPSQAPEDLSGLVALFDVGLERAAQRLVKVLPASGLSPVDRSYLAWMHARAGDVQASTTLSRALVEIPEVASEPAVLAFGYPRAFVDVVKKEAKRSGVPPELLYAVMREESGFNPSALSPRGARGLMQMIPKTARRMAASAGVGRFSLRQLYKPEVSIRLGAHYLKLLLEEFDGDLAAALASYHAGEKTVARWKRRNKNLSVDEFIEEIPYSSTRGYVKKVLGTYGTYRLLYGTDGRPLPELDGGSAPEASRTMISPSPLARRSK
ncbi:MAG: lytic transglycosylase domain-containing protein, partial [Myxococcota bacterium]